MIEFQALELISSTHNERLKQVRKLATRQGRKKTGLISCEGTRHISLLQNPQYLLFADNRKGFACYQALTHRITEDWQECEIFRVDVGLFSSISMHKSAPGVLAVAPKPELYPLSMLQEGRQFVILEDLADPYNCGTIIRTA